MMKLNFLIALIAIQFIASEQCEPYTVKAGDNCWAIWTNNKLTEEAFKAYNPNINCAALAIGQVVCLSPATTTVAPPTVQVNSIPFTSCTQAHVVQKDEYCFSIMTKYKLDPDVFMSLNPTIKCSPLLEGSLVCVGLVVSTTPAPTTATTTTLAPTTTPAPTTTLAPTTSVTYPPLCKQSVFLRPGESCFTLLKTISYDELMRLNPTLNCETIQPGTMVCMEAFPVSTTTTTAAPAACTRTYSIKSGDLCWSLANQYPEFYSLNPSIECGSLTVGQKVCISNCAISTYEVKSGDYCWLIMDSNKISSQKFYELNPGIDCANLKVGQIVTIGSAC